MGWGGDEAGGMKDGSPQRGPGAEPPGLGDVSFSVYLRPKIPCFATKSLYCVRCEIAARSRIFGQNTKSL